MDKITMAHGSGGKITHSLIKDVFFKHLGNDILERAEDSAVIDAGTGNIAFTTDSFVVKPLFFPGGDIGKIAVCGTVNDLAVTGADPKFITCGFIIEEGFSCADLEKIVKSMAKSAKEAGVKIVAGDTKVVGRNEADGMFINTSGIGVFGGKNRRLGSSDIKAGDKVIISGTLGDHGIAVLSKRQGLEFGSETASDCAPLNGVIGELMEGFAGIKFMRDPTRGGLATTLNEITPDSGIGIMLEEKNIPVLDGVRGACELLGLDPLYVANEGKIIVITSPADEAGIIKVLRNSKYGKNAACIGEVSSDIPGKVCIRTRYGVTRIVDMLTAEQLPRIC